MFTKTQNEIRHMECKFGSSALAGHSTRSGLLTTDTKNQDCSQHVKGMHDKQRNRYLRIAYSCRTQLHYGSQFIFQANTKFASALKIVNNLFQSMKQTICTIFAMLKEDVCLKYLY